MARRTTPTRWLDRAWLRDAPLHGWGERHPRTTDIVVGWISAVDNASQYLLVVLAVQLAAQLHIIPELPGVIGKVGTALAVVLFLRASRVSLKALSVVLLAAGGLCFAVSWPLLDAAPQAALIFLGSAVVLSPSTFLLARLRQLQSSDKSRTAGRWFGSYAAFLAVVILVLGATASAWSVGAAVLSMALLRLVAVVVAWALVPGDAPDRNAVRVRFLDSFRIMRRDVETRVVAALSFASQALLALAEVNGFLVSHEPERLSGLGDAGSDWAIRVYVAALLLASGFAILADRLAGRSVRLDYVAAFALPLLAFLVSWLGNVLSGVSFLIMFGLMFLGHEAGSTIASTLRSTVPEWRDDGMAAARAVAVQMFGFLGAVLGPAGVLLRAFGSQWVNVAGLIGCGLALLLVVSARSLDGLKAPRAVQVPRVAAGHMPATEADRPTVEVRTSGQIRHTRRRARTAAVTSGALGLTLAALVAVQLAGAAERQQDAVSKPVRLCRELQTKGDVLPPRIIVDALPPGNDGLTAIRWTDENVAALVTSAALERAGCRDGESPPAPQACELAARASFPGGNLARGSSVFVQYRRNGVARVTTPAGRDGKVPDALDCGDAPAVALPRPVTRAVLCRSLIGEVAESRSSWRVSKGRSVLIVRVLNVGGGTVYELVVREPYTSVRLRATSRSLAFALAREAGSPSYCGPQ